MKKLLVELIGIFSLKHKESLDMDQKLYLQMRQYLITFRHKLKLTETYLNPS